ncbi:hypothetical protein RRG08_012020 [Elysia crispata]|uniref:Uncharacterized protein n=1 Tax=Elysia crispata TaxID=231223 RepID=A0AAE0ZXM9_9GAST|nr:hypothetical protein RRG08_012020 [Elysia crispata]
MMSTVDKTVSLNNTLNTMSTIVKTVSRNNTLDTMSTVDKTVSRNYTLDTMSTVDKTVSRNNTLDTMSTVDKTVSRNNTLDTMSTVDKTVSFPQQTLLQKLISVTIDPRSFSKTGNTSLSTKLEAPPIHHRATMLVRAAPLLTVLTMMTMGISAQSQG